MFGTLGRNLSKFSNQIGQGVKKTWGTIGGIGHKVNNTVHNVASFIHGATSGMKGIPIIDKVHQISGDVVKYSDVFKQGLNFGDKVANSLERVTKTVSDVGDGKMNSSQLRNRIQEHVGEGRGQYNDIKHGMGGLWSNNRSNNRSRR